MADRQNLLLSSSPHVFSGATVTRLMLNVIIALLPPTGYGIYLYGTRALALVAVSVVSAVFFEVAFRALIKAPPRYKDLSAVVTGLLLALILPPSTPLWMVAFGSFGAVVIAKEFFGGLGHNPFNPALIGRGILVMSFPAAMTTWHRPLGTLTEATTGATPLNIIKLGGTVGDVAKSMGLSAPGEVYWNLFLGTRSGSLGESSILLIMVGAAFLLLTKTIDFRAPAALLGSAALASLLFGQDPLFQLLSGGIIFGAFFMATDYVSAPITPAGKWIFGAGAGLITVLIRQFGGFPEGVTYGILIMNAFAPHLNKLVTAKYGAPKRGEQ